MAIPAHDLTLRTTGAPAGPLGDQDGGRLVQAWASHLCTAVPDATDPKEAMHRMAVQLAKAAAREEWHLREEMRRGIYDPRRVTRQLKAVALMTRLTDHAGQL